MIHLPDCTIQEYLRRNCPGDRVAAIEFYGSQIAWSTVFDKAEDTARALARAWLWGGRSDPGLSLVYP